MLQEGTGCARDDEGAGDHTRVQEGTRCRRRARGYRSTHYGAGHHTRVQHGEGEVAVCSTEKCKGIKELVERGSVNKVTNRNG